MVKAVTWLSGLLMFSSMSFAAEVKSWATIDEHRYCFAITEAMVTATPLWKEDSPNPPLAARDAIRIAKVELALLAATPDQWTFDGISLRPWPEGRHWYYEVNFSWLPIAAILPANPEEKVSFWPTQLREPGIVIRRSRPIQLNIPVLMNGSVVHPTRQEAEVR